MELLIKNARIVDSSQDFKGDIYIKDGIINIIGQELSIDCEVIDAKGNVVLPSFIDLHCHFRDPGYTHKEDIHTGSMAAVKGGYTAVNLMANTKPICSSMDTVNYVLNKAKKIGLIDIHQTVSITDNMNGMDIDHLSEIDIEKVAFISDDGKGVNNNKVMMEAMIKAKEKGICVISHAESEEFSNKDMRLAENLMTWRDLTLAQFTGARLHMAHVSTKEALDYVIESKKRGDRVTCEVTPHHLVEVKHEDYRVNPPIRKKQDIEALIEGIESGWVDAIATDHAPHTEEDKKNGAPGISGIETCFPLCYTELVRKNRISLSKLSEVMSKKPAKIMRLNKGELKIGYDGDLVIVDIDKKYTIDSKHFISKGKNTPFNEVEVYGEILTTIKKGKIVFQK